MVKRVEKMPDIDAIVARCFSADEVDIIIVEGYKSSDKPKLEISRNDVSDTLLEGIDDTRVAVITDKTAGLQVPEFGLDDAAGVAEFIINKFVGIK